MANKPFFFTSFVATSAMMLSMFIQTFCLIYNSPAIALAKWLLDIDLTAFVVA